MHLRETLRGFHHDYSGLEPSRQCFPAVHPGSATRVARDPHKCTHDYDWILSDHSQPLLLLCCLTASLVTPIYHRDCSFHVAVSFDCFVTCKCSVACQTPVIKLAGSTLCATAATCAVGFLSSVLESFAHRAGAFRLPAGDLDRFWSRLANELGRI